MRGASACGYDGTQKQAHNARERSVSILGLIGLLTLVSLLLPLANRFNFPFTVLLAAVGIVLGLIIEVAGEHPGGWILGDFLTGLDGLGVTSDIRAPLRIGELPEDIV